MSRDNPDEVKLEICVDITCFTEMKLCGNICKARSDKMDDGI